MNLNIISFTENGIRTSIKTAGAMKDTDVRLYTKWSGFDKKDFDTDIIMVNESISDWATGMMREKQSLLFIGACGIAVRAIAPGIESKLSDSPVLVMDEQGAYVIPILSGHYGGANRLAKSLAGAMGAVPVITTATDINDAFAIDVWARDNGLTIINKDGIAKVSSKVLNGENIIIKKDFGPADVVVTGHPEDIKQNEALLILKPKEYVIGAGCRLGKDPGEFDKFIDDTLSENGIDSADVYAIASIDLKKDEQAFLSYARIHGLQFLTFSKEELNDVKGDFSSSDFVKEQTGTDNVCERAAVKGAGDGGTLIVKKTAKDGMTIAIAKRDWRKNLKI